ncbi:MAG: hypothetical protein KA978_17110 [Deltaproteobacteria bacterium]|nr:hypothetical protein [Deltaproteobacteria bacterium]
MLHRDLVALAGACLIAFGPGCGGVARGALDIYPDATTDGTQHAADASGVTDADAPVIDGPAADIVDAAIEDASVAVDLGGDAPALDRGAIDAPTQETGLIDVGSPDAGATDVGSIDVGAIDTGPPDGGVFDTGTIDAGAVDTGPLDTGPRDAGVVDAGHTDTGPSDVVRTITCSTIVGSRMCIGVNPCCIMASPVFPPTCGNQVPMFGCLPN